MLILSLFDKSAVPQCPHEWDEKVSINFIRLVLLLSKRTRGNDNSKNNRGVRFHMGTSAACHNCGEGREVFTRFVICVVLSSSLFLLSWQTCKRAHKSIQMFFVILKSAKGWKCFVNSFYFRLVVRNFDLMKHSDDWKFHWNIVPLSADEDFPTLLPYSSVANANDNDNQTV